MMKNYHNVKNMKKNKTIHQIKKKRIKRRLEENCYQTTKYIYSKDFLPQKGRLF